MEHKNTYNLNDLQFFESQTMYSGFGKMANSKKITAPAYPIGNTTRNQRMKVFNSKQIAQTDFTGKYCNGPATYFPSKQKVIIQQQQVQIARGNNTQKFFYKQDPRTIIGKAQRTHFASKPKYNHYKREEKQFYPNQSDHFRRSRSAHVQFGTEARVSLNYQIPKQNPNLKGTPGPQYNPGLKPEIPNSQNYSFGYRRKAKGQDPLICTNATTSKVGPSTYFSNKDKLESISKDDKKGIKDFLTNVPFTSKHRNAPNHAIGKGPKVGIPKKPYSLYDTYDVKNKACMKNYDFDYDAGRGLQPPIKTDPRKVSENPLFKHKMLSNSFGKQRRGTSFRGQFNQFMTNQPAKIRIEHPRI